MTTKSYSPATGWSAFSSERSRPIMAESASSAPARSIEATARSISPWWMICSIGSCGRARRTSSARSCPGSSPGSWSGCPADRGRPRAPCCPSSANATARFSVEVVFATPPFWLASAMTLPTVAPLEVDARGCGRAMSCKADMVPGRLSAQASRVLLEFRPYFPAGRASPGTDPRHRSRPPEPSALHGPRPPPRSAAPATGEQVSGLRTLPVERLDPLQPRQHTPGLVHVPDGRRPRRT